ncbi:MAG TPA: NAD(P)-binding domain-containing protein, partial [bacterium]|nr:NAD(P)-binding domain-containing protein [bacterium]
MAGRHPMRIGIIGSGVVGQTLGKKLAELGHDVMLGTRDPQKLDEKKN